MMLQDLAGERWTCYGRVFVVVARRFQNSLFGLISCPNFALTLAIATNSICHSSINSDRPSDSD